MKTKKIIGRIEYGHEMRRLLVLPIDDTDVLVNQVANSISTSLNWPGAEHWPSFQKAARAALRSIGVSVRKKRMTIKGLDRSDIKP